MSKLEPAWRVEVAERISSTPIAVDDHVVVQTGGTLLGLDPATGRTAWSRVVDASDHAGSFLVHAADRILWERSIEPRKRCGVAATTGAGEAAWTADFAAMPVVMSVCVVGDHFFVLGTDTARQRDVIVTLEIASGRQLAVEVLPYPAGRMTAHAAELICWNRQGGPGAFRLSPSTMTATLLEAGGVAAVHAAAGRVLVAAVVGAPPAPPAPCDIRILGERGTWRVRATEACALDATRALTISDTEPWIASLRDAQSGDVLWAGDELPGEPARAFLSASTVCVVYLFGMAVYRRADGRLLGHVKRGLRAVVAGERLFVTGGDWIACYPVTWA